MTVNTPLLVTFAGYLLLMVGIGFWAWRSTKNFDDYILGGRSLESVVTALSAGASDMSGWLLMGLPGAMYLGGASEAWIVFGLILGALANWRFVAGPLRVYTDYTGDPVEAVRQQWPVRNGPGRARRHCGHCRGEPVERRAGGEVAVHAPAGAPDPARAGLLTAVVPTDDG